VVLAGTPAEPAAAATPTDDLEAYELYLRGRYFWNLRTRDGLTRALALFEEALARDASFALAHAGMADALVVLPYHTDAFAIDAYDRARRSAERALALNPELGYARAALAFSLTGLWAWDEARESFDRALALSPGYATGHPARSSSGTRGSPTPLPGRSAAPCGMTRAFASCSGG
jgi:tetratricopeptide (TPR) repeat protein